MIVKKQKRKNRGWLLLVGAFVLLGFIEYVEAEKKYPVYFTDPEWGRKINELEFIKGVLDNSDVPSRDVKFIKDSILTKFQNQIRQQVVPQLPKQQPKKDTIPK